MKLRQLPSQCIAPFRLKEITLHGIGSYYQPARLEVKPLTILCGANGAGKSTWIKVLSTLKDATQSVTLPNGTPNKFPNRLFASFSSRRLLNTTVWREGPIHAASTDWESYCGPLGSLSVSFICTRKTHIVIPEEYIHELTSPTFFGATSLNKGQHVRVRATSFCQRIIADQDKLRYSTGLRVSIDGHYVEWRCIDQILCLFEGEEKTDGSNLLSQDSISRQISDNGIPVSGAFLANDADAEEPVRGKVRDIVSSAYTILSKFSEGFFKIDAIRLPVDTETLRDGNVENEHEIEDTSVQPTTFQNKCLNALNTTKRYVEANGESAHLLYDLFKTVPVIDPLREHGHSNDNSVNADSSLKSPPSDNSGSPFAWMYLYEYHYAVLLRFQAALFKIHEEYPDNKHITDLLSAFEDAMRSQVFPVFFLASGCNATGDAQKVYTEIRAAVSQILEPVLSSFRNEPDRLKTMLRCFDLIRQRDASVIAAEDENTYEWARFLIDGPDKYLSSVEQAYLERWFRLKAYVGVFGIHGSVYSLSRKQYARVDDLFKYWAERFIDDIYKSVQGSHVQSIPAGYVTLMEPSCRIDNAPPSFYNRTLDDSYIGNHHRHPQAFDSGWLSAGFHQLFPIVVQMSIMRMNELLAVENPEVHLHPGLQLKVMEFFIENARIGKFSLIETHSDLMIRRLMRAITEETIRQSWVNVCFVRTEIVERHEFVDDTLKSDGVAVAPEKWQDIWTSVLEPLRIDNTTGINWPDGFLDDDEKETKALMRARYKDQIVEDGLEDCHE